MSLEGVQLGHYRLTQFLKGGGMGEIYLAEDLALPRQVAIKVMKGEQALYPDSQAAQEAERLFQREMKVIAALDHPHILTLLEAGEQNLNHERITYMVMPYCPAGSLADWIRQFHGNNPLSPQEVSQLLLQAGEALQHAHDQGILHLDIKPQNFLVRRQQDQTALPNLLLADFGVAKIANATKMSGTARGTYFYMAPEQLANKPVPASDQYALAIMAYELLAGRMPFEGALPEVIFYQHSQVTPDPPSKVNLSLPQALDEVILRALAKKPEERFASVREFAQAFAAVVKPGGERRWQGSQESKPYDSGRLAGATQTTQEQLWQQTPPPYQQAVPPPYQPYQQYQSVVPPPPPPYEPIGPSPLYQQYVPPSLPGQQAAWQAYGQPYYMPYASVWLRIVALLIDGFILGVVSGIISPIISAFTINAATSANSYAGATNDIITGLVIILILNALLVSGYFISMEATQGATLGKKALGLRIVTVDGKPIGWKEAIIRFLLRIIDNFCSGGLIGFICILATEKQQRVGDMAAKTIVIKTR